MTAAIHLPYRSILIIVSPSFRERLEKPQRLGAVAHQHVLRLLVVVEHHLVRLATDAGLLVPAERRVRGVCVVAVGPHSPRLDPPPEPVGGVEIAGPYA